MGSGDLCVNGVGVREKEKRVVDEGRGEEKRMREFGREKEGRRVKEGGKEEMRGQRRSEDGWRKRRREG